METHNNSTTATSKKECAETCLDLLLIEIMDFYSTNKKDVGVGEGVEAMGFQVGSQLAERYSKNKPRFGTSLDIVKFLCKEFWIEVFRKQIDNLKTNHRGIFVLYDSNFRWLRRVSMDKNSSNATTVELLKFPCGLVRGALATLGIKAIVSAEISSSLPACSFTVKIIQEVAK